MHSKGSQGEKPLRLRLATKAHRDQLLQHGVFDAEGPAGHGLLGGAGNLLIGNGAAKSDDVFGRQCLSSYGSCPLHDKLETKPYEPDWAGMYFAGGLGAAPYRDGLQAANH